MQIERFDDRIWSQQCEHEISQACNSIYVIPLLSLFGLNECMILDCERLPGEGGIVLPHPETRSHHLFGSAPLDPKRSFWPCHNKTDDAALPALAFT